VSDQLPVTGAAGSIVASPDEAREFGRLRRGLQLTNLRIGRLYLLSKGQRQAAPAAEPDGPLEELYVSDQEFQQHLSALSGLPPATLADPDASESLHAIDRAVAILQRKIRAEIVADARREMTSRFDNLCSRLELSPLDQEILLIVLAPEIDRRYRRVFAYLHDDFTRGIPSVGLVVDILAPLLGTSDRLGILSRLESGSPLIRAGLVELLASRADDVRPFAQRHLRVGDAAAGWLLGVPRMSEAVADRASFDGHRRSPPPVTLPPEAPSALADVAERILQSERGVTVFMLCKEQAGGRAATDMLCALLGAPMVSLEVGTFIGGGERVLEDLGRALQDAWLFGAVLHLVGFPDVETTEPAMVRNLEAVWRRIQQYAGHVILPGKEPPPAAWLADNRYAMPFKLDAPNFTQRVEVLKTLLDGSGVGVDLDAEEIETLANRYRLGRQQLLQSVAFARDIAWARSQADGKGEPPRLDMDDIVEGMRAQFSRDVGGLARRIEPRFEFEDLVMPKKEKSHLQELLAFVEKRGKVYESWGFQSRFPRGTGAKALFFGRSGTGKTMAAECIARRLGMDLFTVDLSSVVSKWVGETEKNLGAIFDRAEEAQAVLLFDEADALFGSRTQVGNAVDRYANLETNYLLQRIETYDGVAILSSNLKQNIDEAFTRRFHFIIEFPFPDRPSREEIWQRAYPPSAPLGDDVDFGFLADKFKFTGGNIKNSVLRSAFLGAEEGEKIRMVHILKGILREYQNLEREPVERDFGAWWPEVKHLVDKGNKGTRRKDRR
jgi:AAA+ superfamily predicted ATPase